MLLTFFLLHYKQVLCQYRLCKADHAYLTYLMLQRQLSHLNGCVTTTKLSLLYLANSRAAAAHYIASARTAQKTASNSFSIFCVRICCGHYPARQLFPQPLLNNGCCITAYFEAVSWERVYMAQYCACCETVS
jgi:hypothetical protein